VPRRPNVERGTETGSASALAVQPLGLSVICRRDTPSTPSSFHRTQSHATHCHWAANSQYGSRGPNNLCCKSHCKSDDMMALLTPGRFLVRRDRATLTCCILTTTVLQDPSVASAPLEKRIAFLQSKNLTQEEVDVSLARAAAEDPSQPAPPPTSAPPNYAYNKPPPAAPAYNYPPQGYWQQPPPPE
jgi:hypothetical protein